MHGNELVHDAAGHAGEFVLGLLAQQRLFDRINCLAGGGFDQGGGADFQRGAAGQAAAQRHGGMQQHVQPAGIDARAPESRRGRRAGNCDHFGWPGLTGAERSIDRRLDTWSVSRM